jgi:predicted RNA-binding protein
MCLSKAYVETNGDRELLMEEIASVEIEDNKLLFKTLFGEQKEVEAKVRQIDFMTHSIFLKNLKEGDVSSKDR